MVTVKLHKALDGWCIEQRTADYTHFSAKGHNNFASAVHHINGGDAADDLKCEMRVKLIHEAPTLLQDYAQLVWMLDSVIVNNCRDTVVAHNILTSLGIARRQDYMRKLGVMDVLRIGKSLADEEV